MFSKRAIAMEKNRKENRRNRDDRPLMREPLSPMCEEQEKKRSIILAAATLFANKGYAGTSVREIVEAAGITKPTLYYYFKNKEDLYIKLMDESMETFAQLLQQSLTRTGNMRERIVGLFCDIFQLFSENVDILRLVNSMIYGPQGATPAYTIDACHDHLNLIFSEILSSGIAEGELSEENQTEVLLVLHSLLGSIQCNLVRPDLAPVFTPQSLGATIDLLFDGAKTPPQKRR